MPLELFEAGTIVHLAAAEGEKIAVGALLAVIATAGENVDQVKQSFAGGKTPAAPVAKPAAVERPAPVAVAPPAPAAVSRGRVRISPLARRVAKDRGISIDQLRGTGPGGRIIRSDLANVAAGPALAPLVADGQTRVRELSKLRQTIAKRLQLAKQNIPHFYETIDIDVEELSRLRSRLNEKLAAEGIKLSLGDLIAKGVAVALHSHPGLNATFDGQTITEYADVNLGMAVALEGGLIVPVLRGINHLSVRDIRVRSADLIERARKQRLRQEELTGATFTVSNLGAFGVRDFVAIINPPEVAILAIGTAAKRPTVDATGGIAARTMMSVTLSADHRAVDGAAAAQFLQTFRDVLQSPQALAL
jgi:pyruvate dehydrogenase E2 component (dihydrolipoamide acetyltransferase)